MTRLSVPISITAAMPTVIWNSDRRNSRASGNSAVAASAKGRKCVPIRVQNAPFGAACSASSSIGGIPGETVRPTAGQSGHGRTSSSAWHL